MVTQMESIKTVRKAKGMTQVQLAEKVGCTQKDISRWESGERTPNTASLKKLSQALGCSMDDLV